MSDPSEPESAPAASPDPTPDRAPLPDDEAIDSLPRVTVPPPPTPPKPTDTPTSAKRIPRTWPQRLTVAAVFVMAIASFGAAGALYAGQRVIEDRNLAPTLIDPSASATAAGDG